MILYKSREEIITKNITLVGDLELDLNLKDIMATIGKYNNTSYEPIINYFRNLRNKEIVINALQKNKSCETTYTSIIHKVTTSRHKNEQLKNVKLQVDGEMINMILNVKKYFVKMHLTIQYSLNSKYAKLLYELLKDYEQIKTLHIDYDILIGLLNIKNHKRYIKYSYFNEEILKTTIKEINEKSDIIVSYEPIKEKPEGQRLQVTKIKFFIDKQPESRLQELGLIQESITSHKLYNKSKSKLDKLVKGSYSVIDEEMWITTDINKNEFKYESEIRIDTWLKETSQDDKNMVYESLAKSIDDCEDPIVIIEDYKIIGLFSKDTFTKSASETIELLNQIIIKINPQELES